MVAKNRILAIESYLRRAEALCAKHEKCSADMHVKLIQWGLSKEDAKVVILKLIKDGFIDDARFAEIFVREKSKFNRWGRLKIMQALRLKGISEKIITEALNQIDIKSEEESLSNLLSKKVKTIKADSDYELKSKLIRFALSRGYKYDEVCRIAETFIKEKAQQN